MSHINVLWKSDTNNIDIKSQLCCGCGNCMNSCPKGAVQMQYDIEGFLYPKLDSSKCVDCGICVSKCPMIQIPDLKGYLHTFAGYSNKPWIIEKCASGGVCTALSEKTIVSGGVVYGVQYSKNFCESEYAKAEQLKDIYKFMTSKYVQSKKGDIFKDIRDEVWSGRKILFVGCPCDVHALKLFLRHEYENLLLCELVCMGVTSYKVAEEYITAQERKHGNIVSLNSKGKKFGWFIPCLDEEYSDGQCNSKSFFGTYYGLGFTRLQRPSCSRCPYRGKIGVGDIRVGDFWGIQKKDAYWNSKGVSSIFARSEKGTTALYQLKDDDFSLYEIDYLKASVNNNMDSSNNYTDNQYRRRKKFVKVFLEQGLFAACAKTASGTFWLKHFIPPYLAIKLKHIRHAITDIKIK